MSRTVNILLLALLPFLGCSVRRPSQVPKESVWVGDRSQGVFVLVGEREGSRWRVKIWGRDGTLRVDSPFVLRGMARASIEPHEVAAWDGRQLSLQDGTLLVPAP